MNSGRKNPERDVGVVTVELAGLMFPGRVKIVAGARALTMALM